MKEVSNKNNIPVKEYKEIESILINFKGDNEDLFYSSNKYLDIKPFIPQLEIIDGKIYEVNEL